MRSRTLIAHGVVLMALLMAVAALIPHGRGDTPARAAENERLLFGFESGVEGWGLIKTETPAEGTGVAQSTAFATEGTHGLLVINRNAGAWFGLELGAPLDLSAYAQFAFDIRTTAAGTSRNVAFQVGDSWEWCQGASWGWVDPGTTSTVTVDLGQTFACSGPKPLNSAAIRAIYVFFSPGEFAIDNVRAYGIPTATLTPTPRNTPEPTPTLGPTPTVVPRTASFVYRNGPLLFLDKRPFRFAGTNNYYLMYKSKLMVDDVLETAAANSFTVVRHWGSLEIGYEDGSESVDGKKEGVYFQYFDGRAPRYNDGPDGLERLDYIIYRAGQLNLKLIIPLVNNWNAFGGIDQYVRWRGGTYHDEFYTDPLIRAWYRNWTAHLLNRVNSYTGVAYKNDPTIMAWELANEPRCKGAGLYPPSPSCSPQTLLPWVREMSGYIKSIDRHHLVATGDEGFYCRPGTSDDWTINCSSQEGVDTLAFAALPAIDWVSLHLYPDHWGKTPEWGNGWIEQHIKDAYRLGKPAVLGEFGLQDPSADDANRNRVYQAWTDTVQRNRGAGSLFWILSGHQDDGTLYPDYDGFTVYCPSSTCELLSRHAREMARGLR